jgi:1,2-diacylglycerol 3-beta-glucosyltransferase
MLVVPAIAASSVANTVIVAVFVTVGCVGATFALYLLLLSIAAHFYSDSRQHHSSSSRIAVLIPAHNESALIARCVRSLSGQTYPRGLYEIIVIADNCTDDTATIAGTAGADEVMVRDEPDVRGKGQALRWAMDRVLHRDAAPDAVVVVDADSISAPEFLAGLAAHFDAGATAVQAQDLLYESNSAGTALSVAALLLMNRVRPAGRAVLRLPGTHLAGNGMLLARDLLLSRPWEAFSSTEDLEYSLALCEDGIWVTFAGDAAVYAPPAPNRTAAEQQALRWQGGKANLARTWISRLTVRALRDRSPRLLGAAFDLAVPPLALLVAAIFIGTVIGVPLVATGVAPLWTLIPWLVGLLAIPFHVVLGLRAAGASRAAYAAMLRAPRYVLSTALRAHRILSFRGDTWVRTERDVHGADDGVVGADL